MEIEVAVYDVRTLPMNHFPGKLYIDTVTENVSWGDDLSPHFATAVLGLARWESFRSDQLG